MKHKDENRVQNDVRHGAQKHSHHADAAKALGVDEAVHAEPSHHEQAPQEVYGHILVRIRVGGIAGAEQIEHGPLQNQPQHRQPHAEQHHHGKGIAHDPLRLVHISPPSLDGAEGGASHAE